MVKLVEVIYSGRPSYRINVYGFTQAERKSLFSMTQKFNSNRPRIVFLQNAVTRHPDGNITLSYEVRCSCSRQKTTTLNLIKSFCTANQCAVKKTRVKS